MEGQVPTIKGGFVMSHVNALSSESGENSIQELQRRCGRSLNFGFLEDVPITVENEILEHIVDMHSHVPLTPAERARKAGELHFENFVTTTLGDILFPIFGRNLKYLFMSSATIGKRVFSGMEFSPMDLGENAVTITISNIDYPLEHFVGFFDAWIASAGFKGEISARVVSPRVYEYTIRWH